MQSGSHEQMTDKEYSSRLMNQLHLYLDRTPLVEFDQRKLKDASDKQNEQERLFQVNKVRDIIGELVADWEEYVKLHKKYLEISADFFLPYKDTQLDGLNIDNIAEYENVIKGIPSKVALTTVKKEYWTIISDKSRNVSHYIKLKTKYLAPICDLLTTDPKAIKQCLIEFATNGWLYFFKQISKKVSLREIKAILLKHKCTKVELETSPRQRIIYNIELGVSDSLPETLPEPLPESETYGGRQYKKPRKSSASATKRRPRRKSSAIKHRRRRTSRK